LKGVNRTTNIIVGIGELHSKSVIHRHPTPDNILLVWDWNVCIADSGQHISLTNPEIPPLIHPKGIDGIPFGHPLVFTTLRLNPTTTATFEKVM
jgi:serine/threonine protein kinase